VRCLLAYLGCSPCGDCQGGEAGVDIKRCLMDAHRFTDAGVVPQLDSGDREKRPSGWIGERVRVSNAFMQFLSMAMRMEIRAKSTVLRRD